MIWPSAGLVVGHTVDRQERDESCVGALQNVWMPD